MPGPDWQWEVQMKWTEPSIESIGPLSSESVKRTLSKLLTAKKGAISEIPVVSPLVHSSQDRPRVIKTGHHLAFSPFAPLGRQVFLPA